MGSPVLVVAMEGGGSALGGAQVAHCLLVKGGIVQVGSQAVQRQGCMGALGVGRGIRTAPVLGHFHQAADAEGRGLEVGGHSTWLPCLPLLW